MHSSVETLGTYLYPRAFFSGPLEDDITLDLCCYPSLVVHAYQTKTPQKASRPSCTNGHKSRRTIMSHDPFAVKTKSVLRPVPVGVATSRFWLECTTTRRHCKLQINTWHTSPIVCIQYTLYNVYYTNNVYNTNKHTDICIPTQITETHKQTNTQTNTGKQILNKHI